MATIDFEELFGIERKGYEGIKALVAFSGKVTIKGDKTEYTETGMNGISEEKLPKEFDKDDYFEALDEIVGNLMGSDPEMLGYYNRDGFLVFSFEDYPSVFTVCDEEENVIGMSNVRLLAEGDEGEIVDYSYYTTSSGYGYSNNSTDITVIGAEDGVNVGSMTAEGNGIDGIPASEIRTYIDGIPGSYQRTRYVITAVNLSYRFLKDYLNWMA